MTLEELLQCDLVHIEGRAAKLWLTGTEWVVHSSGSTSLELDYPIYAGTDQAAAIAAFWELEQDAILRDEASGKKECAIMYSLDEKVKVGLVVTKKLIADMEAKQRDAIRREDWELAAHLATYISGMNQIVTIFEIAVGDE